MLHLYVPYALWGDGDRGTVVNNPKTYPALQTEQSSVVYDGDESASDLTGSPSSASSSFLQSQFDLGVVTHGTFLLRQSRLLTLHDKGFCVLWHVGDHVGPLAFLVMTTTMEIRADSSVTPTSRLPTDVIESEAQFNMTSSTMASSTVLGNTQHLQAQSLRSPQRVGQKNMSFASVDTWSDLGSTVQAPTPNDSGVASDVRRDIVGIDKCRLGQNYTVFCSATRHGMITTWAPHDGNCIMSRQVISGDVACIASTETEAFILVADTIDTVYVIRSETLHIASKIQHIRTPFYMEIADRSFVITPLPSADNLDASPPGPGRRSSSDSRSRHVTTAFAMDEANNFSIWTISNDAEITSMKTINVVNGVRPVFCGPNPNPAIHETLVVSPDRWTILDEDAGHELVETFSVRPTEDFVSAIWGPGGNDSSTSQRASLTLTPQSARTRDADQLVFVSTSTHDLLVYKITELAADASFASASSAREKSLPARGSSTMLDASFNTTTSSQLVPRLKAVEVRRISGYGGVWRSFGHRLSCIDVTTSRTSLVIRWLSDWKNDGECTVNTFESFSPNSATERKPIVTKLKVFMLVNDFWPTFEDAEICFFCAGFDDGKLELYIGGEGRVATCSAFEAPITALCVVAARRLVFVGSGTGVVKAFNLPDLALLNTFYAHAAGVTKLVTAPAAMICRYQTVAASVSSDGCVALYRWEDSGEGDQSGRPIAHCILGRVTPGAVCQLVWLLRKGLLAVVTRATPAVDELGSMDWHHLAPEELGIAVSVWHIPTGKLERIEREFAQLSRLLKINYVESHTVDGDVADDTFVLSSVATVARLSFTTQSVYVLNIDVRRVIAEIFGSSPFKMTHHPHQHDYQRGSGASAADGSRLEYVILPPKLKVVLSYLFQDDFHPCISELRRVLGIAKAPGPSGIVCAHRHGATTMRSSKSHNAYKASPDSTAVRLIVTLAVLYAVRAGCYPALNGVIADCIVYFTQVLPPKLVENPACHLPSLTRCIDLLLDDDEEIRLAARKTMAISAQYSNDQTILAVLDELDVARSLPNREAKGIIAQCVIVVEVVTDSGGLPAGLLDQRPNFQAAAAGDLADIVIGSSHHDHKIVNCALALLSTHGNIFAPVLSKKKYRALIRVIFHEHCVKCINSPLSRRHLAGGSAKTKETVLDDGVASPPSSLSSEGLHGLKALDRLAAYDPKEFCAFAEGEIRTTGCTNDVRCCLLKVFMQLVKNSAAMMVPHMHRLLGVVWAALDPSTGHTAKDGVVPLVINLFKSLVKLLPMVSFHQNSQRLAVGGVDGNLTVYDVRNGSKFLLYNAAQYEEDTACPVLMVAFSILGDELATQTSKSSMVRVWKWESGMFSGLTHSMPTAKLVASVAVPQNFLSLRLRLAQRREQWVPTPSMISTSEENTPASPGLTTSQIKPSSPKAGRQRIPPVFLPEELTAFTMMWVSPSCIEFATALESGHSEQLTFLRQ